MTKPNYLSPETVRDALSLLARFGDRARVISGGTDLLVQIKRRSLLPEVLVSLKSIRELDYIKFDRSDGLRIGPLTTAATIEANLRIRKMYGILSQAAGLLGTPAIRAQATIGGNLCNASPSADLAPPLLVLGATVKFADIDGERTLPFEKFIVGPGATAMKRNQILLEIRVPTPPARCGGAYVKQTRGRGADIALASVAAFVTMAREFMSDARIALGAVAPIPIRARKAEGILRGAAASDRLLEECGRAAAEETTPVDDIRTSAEYRRQVVEVLTKRAVKEAVCQAALEVQR